MDDLSERRDAVLGDRVAHQPASFRSKHDPYSGVATRPAR